jgi:hypothetical protein
MIIKLNKNQSDYLCHSLSEEQEALKSKLRQLRKECQIVIM